MKAKRRIHRHIVSYIPPGRRRAKKISVGPRAHEMIKVLDDQPSSRVEMLKLGRPRIALNATSTIRTLRTKGFYIHSEWETAEDGDFFPVRYVRYSLKGRVIGSQQIKR